MVQLILRLKVAPERATAVVRALPSGHVGGAMASRLADAQVDRDLDDPHALHYREEWLTAGDVAREVGSDRFSACWS